VSRITKGEKKPSRQRKKILEYLLACFDTPRAQHTDVTKRGAKMHTQYKNLMDSMTAQLETRRQQQQAEQQQLQEIEEDRGMVPQNSNLVRNPQDIRRSTGHGSHGFQPIHRAPPANNYQLQETALASLSRKTIMPPPGGGIQGGSTATTVGGGNTAVVAAATAGGVATAGGIANAGGVATAATATGGRTNRVIYSGRLSLLG
jgi:hypothetical protein